MMLVERSSCPPSSVAPQGLRRIALDRTVASFGELYLEPRLEGYARDIEVPDTQPVLLGLPFGTYQMDVSDTIPLEVESYAAQGIGEPAAVVQRAS